MKLNAAPDTARSKFVDHRLLVVRAILFKPDDKVQQYWIDKCSQCGKCHEEKFGWFAIRQIRKKIS
jgi:hypothetical protein